MSDMAQKNKRVVLLLILAAVAMATLIYYSAPLYSAFCKVTGYGGTTQRAAVAPQAVGEKWVTVSFDTNVEQKLPIDFKPENYQMKVKVGEVAQNNFTFTNHSNEPITGVATFNVQPDKAGQYFTKIQCFCFDKITIKANETRTLPVQFYVDSKIAEDKDTDDVENITLSYSFFRAKN